MAGTPPTVNRIVAASAALASPTLLAMRVTSWLPMKVKGVKESRKPLWRFRHQSSSKKFSSSSDPQTAFHSSYWVSESMVERSMMPA